MRWARLIGGIAILVGAGLIHGSWTNRWALSQTLETWGTRLEAVPMHIGRWEGRPVTVNDREMAAAGATGFLSRQYRDTQSGATVSVLLVCGLPGDIASHPPTVCYPGSGFSLTAPEQLRLQSNSAGQTAEFQTAIAKRSRPEGPQTLRISWAWSDGSAWQVPDDPRLAFATAPALSKLYVVRQGVDPETNAADDPCRAFLEALLPELNQALFAEATEPD